MQMRIYGRAFLMRLEIDLKPGDYSRRVEALSPLTDRPFRRAGANNLRPLRRNGPSGSLREGEIVVSAPKIE